MARGTSGWETAYRKRQRLKVGLCTKYRTKYLLCGKEIPFERKAEL